jgi:hypothetical protein
MRRAGEVIVFCTRTRLELSCYVLHQGGTVKAMDTEGENKVVQQQDGQMDTHTPAEVTAPIIVSLGKKRRKAIKRLKRGKGPAMAEVMDVIDQVQASLGAQAEGRILVPVVVIYRQRQRRSRGWF